MNIKMGFPGGSVGKESVCNAGDLGSIPELGRSLGEVHGNPHQYSCLENRMGRGTWRVVVHRVTKKSDTTEVTECTRTQEHQITILYPRN